MKIVAVSGIDSSQAGQYGAWAVVIGVTALLFWGVFQITPGKRARAR